MMLRLLLGLISLVSFLYSDEKPFVVVIPSYNNSSCYQNNLDSVFAQNYENYRVIYIDDASTDQTEVLVYEYILEKGQKDRVTFIQNDKRQGSLANIYRAIWLCTPNEIIVNLDGDDWFYDEHVLEKLNTVYADEDVWVTYGQFIYYPSLSPGWAAQVPEEVILHNAFRDHNWTTTALRTFYAGLFHRIDIESLLYNDTFFPMAGDLAYMWPILEMAGTHSRFIPDILYVYNVGDGVLNDMKANRLLQYQLGLETRKKKRYQPVESPY